MTKLKVYQVETTNACNLTCSFCPKFTDWNQRKIGFMDPALIDRIDWSGTEYTEVQFTGEPTLHKDLLAIIRAIKKNGVRVGFSTNGTFKDRLEAVLNEADIVTVNDDDFRDPVFQDRPNVVVQQLGVTFNIEDYSRKAIVNEVLPQCQTPWDYVSIHYNGDVVPCCKDHSGVVVYGNLYEQTFAEIEDSPRRREFLESITQNERNGLCEYCCSPNPHEIHSRLLEMVK
jgi:radical SAM protein with 4Fe4S-binding SPASM domain